MKYFLLSFNNINVFIKNIFKFFSISYCLFCENKITDGIICNKCEKLKEYINHNHYCIKCGSNIPKNTECSFCNDFFNYKYIRTIVKYDTIIRPIIFGLKYQKKLECSDYILEDILNNFPKEYRNVKFDYVTCVPTHLYRYINRGYNHTEYLSKIISKQLNIPFMNFVKRTKYVKSQTHIQHFKRYINIKDSFLYFNELNIQNKNILVIEDVITTGSTLKEYIKELSKSKANIYVLIYADARHVQDSRGF